MRIGGVPEGYPDVDTSQQPSDVPSERLAALQTRRMPGLGRLLYEAFGVIRDRYFARLAERGYTGIGLTHTRVLRHMDLLGSTLSEIAERSGISRQAVAKAARELEQAGYLRIVDSTNDARAKSVTITDKGADLYEVIIDTLDVGERELERALGRETIRLLQRAVEGIVTAELPPARDP